uniref:Uncharacterized protein n=1 Tax=Rhizophora mucronata TaxID=61149 RepID=A0A2P2N546_RHIMU
MVIGYVQSVRSLNCHYSSCNDKFCLVLAVNYPTKRVSYTNQSVGEKYIFLHFRCICTSTKFKMLWLQVHRTVATGNNFVAWKFWV